MNWIKDLPQGWKQFIDDHLNASVQERDKNSSFDKNLWHKAGHLGFHRLFSLETSLEELYTTIESVSYYSEDNGFNFGWVAQGSACILPIEKFGTLAQKQKFLPALKDGITIAAHAATEHQAGSDIFNLKTQAQATKKGFHVVGTKKFCTLASVADIVLIYTVTDESKTSFGRHSVFIGEKKLNQFEILGDEQTSGLKTAPLTTFNVDADFSPDQILGGPGGGNMLFFESMIFERIGMAHMQNGTTRRLLDQILQVLTSRHSRSQPLFQFQSIAHTFAELEADWAASQQLAYFAVKNMANKSKALKLAAMAKLKSSELLKKTALQCVQWSGAEGCVIPNRFERNLRDAIASTLYSGTSEIQKNIISGFSK